VGNPTPLSGAQWPVWALELGGAESRDPFGHAKCEPGAHPVPFGKSLGRQRSETKARSLSAPIRLSHCPGRQESGAREILEVERSRIDARAFEVN
jgi:hypothetical protein